MIKSKHAMVVEDATKVNEPDATRRARVRRGARQTTRVCLELTEAQVENVIRATADARGPSFSLLLSGLINEQAITEGSLEDRYCTELESGRLSHSLFRGLLILALFISGEEGRGVVEVAAPAGTEPEHDASLHDHARRLRPARAGSRDAQVPAAALSERSNPERTCGTQRRGVPSVNRRFGASGASQREWVHWMVRDTRAFAARQAERTRCAPQGLRGKSWRSRRG